MAYVPARIRPDGLSFELLFRYDPERGIIQVKRRGVFYYVRLSDMRITIAEPASLSEEGALAPPQVLADMTKEDVTNALYRDADR